MMLGRKALRKVSGRSTNLDALVETWNKSNKSRSVHTVDAMWRSVRDFVDNVGNLMPRNVTKITRPSIGTGWTEGRPEAAHKAQVPGAVE